MTAQISDKIIYKGEELSLASEPLAQWLYNNKVDKLFNNINSACWRGYVASWKIEDGKLYLINIDSPPIPKHKELPKYEENQNVMQKLFPGEAEVFASWVNGKLKIQSGELLEYVHMGYESVYETDIYLRFENGVLIDEKRVNNIHVEK